MSPARRNLPSILVAGFIVVSAALADNPAPPPVAPAHETARDVVPPPPRPLETSPTMLVSRDGLVSVQVNVSSFGDNILGDAANEPSLAVNPTNPNNMVIGWRQFDSISSDFRQAGFAYTTDGGATWTFPGKIDPGWFRSDPVVDTDANGVFYYNSLTNNPDYQCKVFRSYNGGVTWAAGVFAQGGDKQWQVIDKSGSVGNGFIYATWNPTYSTSGCNGQFTRSTNGGNSFESCTSVPNSPIWGTLAVGPNGELYLAGGGGPFGSFYVDKSTNAKIAGSTISWTSSSVNLDGSTAYSTGPNPGGLLGQLWVDVDRSNGPRRGWVYVCSTIDRNSPSNDPADVMFARSTDGGSTWSTPVRINDDPAGNGAWQWFATMSVAPSGRIDVAWLDTRNHPGTYLSELYYAYSEDGGTTWSPNVALSPAFNPQLGYPQQNKIGDYYDMTSYDDAAHLAYSATFNNEQDVYYIRITRPLMLLLPNGFPAQVPPMTPTNITVRILPGSEAFVPGTAKMHYRYNSGPYAAQDLTPLGGDLYQATLPPIYCGATPQVYFSAEGTQSGTVYSPRDFPASTYTIDTGVQTVLYSFDMNINPMWTVEDQWAWGTPTGAVAGSGRDPNSGYTGTKVYGFNLNGAYPNNMTQTKYLTTTPLDFSSVGGVTLRFRRWLGVESASYDHANIQVSNNGLSWFSVWDHSGATLNETAWSLQTYDISSVADHQSAVRVRWGMGPTDSSVTYQGWNIDDVEFLALVCNGPALCPGDMNCDGVVDFADIDPFVEALSTPLGVGWTHGNCPWLNGDTNGDNAVDFADIDPFVADIGDSCP